MDIDKILKKILEIDDLVSKKHSHSNKNILDSITQALISNWNNAYTHISDTVKHITSTERTNWNDADSKKHTHSNKLILDAISQTNLNNWNDKYSKNEVDNKISQVVSNMDWKESVATYADIATTYPTPDDGWTVNVKDTDITYRYNGSSWIPISANSIPLASSSIDGKMSKQDKIDHDDMNSKKHIHANKSILDTIAQALIDNWNAAFTHVSDAVRHITSTERSNWNTAYTHISDTIKHITSDERTLWNTVSNKVDKVTGKSLSTNDFDNSYKAKIDGISNNANKVEASTINGNIKIDGAEKTVYIHPSGTNPHGTTKADVGLSNVDNTSDSNKPISTAMQTALNGKANSSHTHDDRYYTESEADTKFATKSEISALGSGDMLKFVYDTNGDGIVDNADKLDGIDSIDYMRATSVEISGDWNNYVRSGMWRVNTSDWSGHINYPVGAYPYGTLTVFRGYQGVYQGAMQMYMSHSNSEVWVRGVYSSSGATNFQPWRRLAWTTEIPTALPANGGDADTAAKLSTARKINGVSFDGSGDITITAAPTTHNHSSIVYNDTRAIDFAPTAYGGLSVHLKSNGIDGLTDGGTYHGIMHIQQWSDISGGQTHQLAFTDNGHIFHRRSTSATTWGSWEKLLTNKQGLTWNDLKGV